VLSALDGGAFLRRRAESEAATAPSDERRLLRHTLSGGGELPTRLLSLCGYLEARGRYDDARAVMDVGVREAPLDPIVALHAARVARRSGDAGAASALYARVRSLDSGAGHLSRMADIGDALMSDQPVAQLTLVLGAGRRAGDRESVAVTLEARARARRAAGDHSGAVRDYTAAIVRFTDALDRGRVAHELADLLTARGEVEAARRVLRFVASAGHPAQASWAGARLHALARATGDEVGRRRWASSGRSEMASLTPAIGRVAPESRSTLRLQDRIERLLRRG